MPSTYLEKTYTNNGNRRTMTFSFWMKLSGLNSNIYPMSIYDVSSGYQADIRHSNANQLRMYATDTAGTARVHLVTNRVLRDVSAWYHIVWTVDTTQATESDRVKLYINGVRETSFGTESYPPQNTDLRWNGNNSGDQGGVTQVGAINGGGDFDGSMAHFYFIDGTAYDADTFGSTDSTTGIWKPKLTPSVTYGNNGFFLNFSNTSDFGEDSSGNNNDFTVNGTMTQTIDTPSNVFATLNFNDFGLTGSDPVLANGGLTTMNLSGAGDYGLRATLGMNKGKWYWEAKYTTGNCTGILPTDVKLIFDMFGSTPEAHVYGVQRYNDSATNFFANTTFYSQNTAAWGGITSGDIIGCALDMDNGKIFYSKNGNFRDLSGNTGDPANGTNPTFTIADTDRTYAPYVELRSNNDNGTKLNFGNGYFGTDAVSSAGTNAGVGTFEYDVPSGFKALCTKNINAQEYS